MQEPTNCILLPQRNKSFFNPLQITFYNIYSSSISSLNTEWLFFQLFSNNNNNNNTVKFSNIYVSTILSHFSGLVHFFTYKIQGLSRTFPKIIQGLFPLSAATDGIFVNKKIICFCSLLDKINCMLNSFAY